MEYVARTEKKTVPVVNCTVPFLRTVLACLLVRYNRRQWGHLTSSIHLNKVVSGVMGQCVSDFNQLCDRKQYQHSHKQDISLS